MSPNRLIAGAAAFVVAGDDLGTAVAETEEFPIVTSGQGIQSPHFVDVMRRNPHIPVSGSYCTAALSRPEAFDYLVRLRVNNG